MADSVFTEKTQLALKMLFSVEWRKVQTVRALQNGNYR